MLKKTLSFILLCFSASLFAQQGELGGGFSNSTTLPMKVTDAEGTTPLELPSEELNMESVEKMLSNEKTTESNFLLETLPEDRDIIHNRNFMGQDMNKKKVSNVDLGSVYTETRLVRVECRDHSAIDGDRIRVFLNGRDVSGNLSLDGGYYVITLMLSSGYNRVDFKALNQGRSGPNTAQLRLYDEKDQLLSDKEWALLKGQVATIGVIKKEE